MCGRRQDEREEGRASGVGIIVKIAIVRLQFKIDSY